MMIYEYCDGNKFACPSWFTRPDGSSMSIEETETELNSLLNSRDEAVALLRELHAACYTGECDDFEKACHNKVEQYLKTLDESKKKITNKKECKCKGQVFRTDP